MTASVAVLAFAAWTLAVAAIYVLPRVPLVLMLKRPADYWTRDRKIEEPAIFTRARHAHLNCVENLPVFAAVVAMALLMDKAAIVDPLASYVFYARVGQSLIHLSGTTFLQILIRATLYIVQIGLMAWMIWQLLA